MSKRGARMAVLEAAYVNWRWPAYLGSVAYRARAISPALFEWLMNQPLELKTRKGPSLHVRLRDAIGPAEVFGLDEYETPLVDWSTPRYVIDAGAHVGAFTIWAAARSACKVMALEPNPEVRRLLEHNVARLTLGERVTVQPWALAGAHGSRYLRPANDSAATALVSEVTTGDLEVESVSLAEAIAASAFPHIDVLKMDIEGAEYEVFAAADDATLQTVRSWIIECHPTPGHEPRAIEDRLRAAGYEVMGTDKPNRQRLLIARR